MSQGYDIDQLILSEQEKKMKDYMTAEQRLTDLDYPSQHIPYLTKSELRMALFSAFFILIGLILVIGVFIVAINEFDKALAAQCQKEGTIELHGRAFYCREILDNKKET